MNKKCYIWSGHSGEEMYLLLLRIKPQFLSYPACD